MAADEKWYFTKEQLLRTPSTRCGYDADRELSYRQQAAHLIQDMGQRLQVSQLCINTAMVYMHRFYVFHSFTQFHLDAMAAAALFLAAKVEEQPRKLEHVIRVKQICLHRELPALNVNSEQYLEQAQDLVFNENVLLQTLGFDVAIDHPHTHVVRCCHLVRASKDLAQTSYFMASNSLHLTTMCLQYKPTVVACFCIHLACKWSNWEIPQSNEGKYWFYYVDKTVTQDLLEQLTDEFLVIFEKCPSRLKKKIKSANQNPATYQFDKMSQSQRDIIHEGVSFQSHHRPQDPNKPSTSQPQTSSQRSDSREYQEKRQIASQGSHSQHRDGHHRSHHAANQHSSAPSALMKPHAGLPTHNKAPHLNQHRSSLSHHPRPDHHRPDHPQRTDHPSRPDHPQRADHQQRARPEHGSRPDHHPRSDHPLRPPEHHPARPDQQQRTEHPTRPDHQRSDHHSRPEHLTRPEHQGRPDHPLRPDHTGSQLRTEHPPGRPDQTNRQEHSGRAEYLAGLERHDRLDGFADQRHSAVTAARDQLRRNAALEREAVRREAMHTLPTSIMNHSPAQRTTSGDSAISSSSSTSLTPSSQDWAGFGSTPATTGGPSPLPPKHSGLETSHRHAAAYEKLKSSGADRRASSTNVSLDRKMMQEISERRQLESFFGKSEALERISEKHQVKHTTTTPYKEVKKEAEPVALQPQPTAIKRERLSPPRQLSMGAPPGRNDMDMTAPSMRQNSFKPNPGEYPLLKLVKTEPDMESISDSRNGTTAPALITPKLEKIEPDSKGESLLVSNRLPPVKSSIFSPEKTLPKERELPMPPRPLKINCPPSPGIAFGSPPVTPGKSQGSKEHAFENMARDGRIEMKNPIVDSRLAPSVPKVEPKPPHLLNKSNYPPLEHKALPYPPSSSNATLASVKSADVRTAMPHVLMEGDLGAVAFPASEAKEQVPVLPGDEGSGVDHQHHKSKKKKEKKEKHKHKDKDKEKHREEKKHKSKHKEKDKERRKSEAVAIEGVQPVVQVKPESLKIKIPKATITTPPVPSVAAPSSGGGLKLKISLASLSSSASGSSSSKESRKRERDRSSPGPEPSHSKTPKLSNVVETPKRGGNPDLAGHNMSSKSNYARQNGLEARGGSRHHMQHPQHYGGSKMVMDDGSTLKPSEISKNSSSHSSTS